MDGEARWAHPVRDVRPRPPSGQRARRYSVPGGMYSTKTELQLDEKSGLLGNDLADCDHHEPNHHHHQYATANATGRRAFIRRADSARDCPARKPAYAEIRPELHKGWGNHRRTHSKSFSSGDYLVHGESLDTHGIRTRHRAVSINITGSSRGGYDAETSTSLSSSNFAPSSTSPDKGQPHHHRSHQPVVAMQVAQEALPGAGERRRPGALLKQRERPPALSIDDSAALHAQHVQSSSLSLSPSSLSPVPRGTTANDASQGDSSGTPGPRPLSSVNQRRRSSAGESASQVSSLGSNSRVNSSARSRRKSTSVLPSISHTPPTPGTGTMSLSPPVQSQHGPGSRKGLAVPGGLQSRSLPEEVDDDDDLRSVHSDMILLTRKKKISSNVSKEYKLAMDDLTIADTTAAAPKGGKRLLSKRWSSLQTSVLAKNFNAGNSRKGAGEDRSSTTEKSSPATGETNNNEPMKESYGSRGWEIVRANLKSIADMAPKDSIDSKPLNFRNIADLVKAKEFRLMMKRRTSFIENGRFQFDEAKEDLYRRYGRLNGNSGPVAAPETHNNHNRKMDGGTKVVNRRKYMGVSGSV